MDYYLATDFEMFGELKPFVRVRKLGLDSIILVRLGPLEGKSLIIDSYAFPDDVREKYDNISDGLIPHLCSAFQIPKGEVSKVERFISMAYEYTKVRNSRIFLMSDYDLNKHNFSIKANILETCIKDAL